jgi:hypothetical protein
MCNGCKLFDEFKKQNKEAVARKKAPKKPEDPMDSCGISSNLNDYEKAYMSKYYKDMESQRRKNKQKVFGGLMPGR